MGVSFSSFLVYREIIRETANKLTRENRLTGEVYFPDLIRTDIAWSQKEILVEEDAVFDEPPHHRVSGYQVDTRNKSRRNSSFPHSRHAMVFPRVCAATVDKIRTSILQLGLLQSWGSALQIKRIHPKSGSTLTGVTNNVMIIR